jgi:hypothetical protein
MPTDTSSNPTTPYSNPTGSGETNSGNTLCPLCNLRVGTERVQWLNGEKVIYVCKECYERVTREIDLQTDRFHQLHGPSSGGSEDRTTRSATPDAPSARSCTTEDENT